MSIRNPIHIFKISAAVLRVRKVKTIHLRPHVNVTDKHYAEQTRQSKINLVQSRLRC